MATSFLALPSFFRTAGSPGPRRWFAIVVSLVAAGLCAARFLWLSADFPNYSQWMEDQAKFTDEGWWSQGAVMHTLLGHWNIPGDYNPAVATPVWPFLLGIVFHLTGVSIVAARALNVAIAVATLGLIYLLVRRFAPTDGWLNASLPAAVAMLLLAASPFAFVFNRLAILETLVIFEFCLLMLAVAYLSGRRIAPLIFIPILVAVMILTKTTAVTSLPALLWLAFCADGAQRSRLLRALRALLAIVVLPLLLVKGYAMLASALGYGADWQYFFSVNAMDEIAWDHSGATLWALLQNCMWIDRILYPLGLAILALSLAWMRRLWRNPLFTASWIALAGQAAFIFRRQEDYAPRYFLPMLVPLVLIVTLAFADVTCSLKPAGCERKALIAVAGVTGLAILASLALNAATIAGFLNHRTTDYFDAAASIRQIILSNHRQRPLILGVSGSQLSLMTGIPSINDAYGTQDLAAKVQRYQPGWYVAWNGVGDDIKPALAAYDLQQVSAYPVFDDDDRNRLILYRMTPRHQAR